MKFPPLTLLQPGTVADASISLRNFDGDAKIVAGGQSLLPLLAFRLATPTVLIDITGLPSMSGVAIEPSEIVVGGLTTHREVELFDRLPPEHLAIRDGMRVLGHVSIRNRGTVGGSLAHSDPSAEWSALLVGLDGEVDASSDRGVRRIAATDLATGWFSTSLEPDEVITAVRFPRPPTRSASALSEMARRSGDFALCGTVVQLVASANTVEGARVVAFGIAPTPRRLAAVEEALVGQVVGKRKAEAATVALAASAYKEIRVDNTQTRYLVEHLLPALVGDAIGLAVRRLAEGDGVGVGP